jgi:hypothetical protein
MDHSVYENIVLGSCEHEGFKTLVYSVLPVKPSDLVDIGEDPTDLSFVLHCL